MMRAFLLSRDSLSILGVPADTRAAIYLFASAKKKQKKPPFGVL